MFKCDTCGEMFEYKKGRLMLCEACKANRHRERSRKSMQKRRTEHHEEHLATRRAYYAKNAEQERERSRQWREDNPWYDSNTATPEEQAAYNAIQRCTNPNHPRYEDWGGRGVEWRFESVAAFIEHIGLRPSDKHSLDRICVNGHYDLDNVQWVTSKEQASNVRLPDGTCWCHRKTLKQLNKLNKKRRA